MERGREEGSPLGCVLSEAVQKTEGGRCGGDIYTRAASWREGACRLVQGRELKEAAPRPAIPAPVDHYVADCPAPLTQGDT